MHILENSFEILLFFIWQIWHYFTTMLALIRYILLGIWIAIVTTIGIVICFSRPRHPENLSDLCYLIQLAKYFLGIDMRRRNDHYLKEGHPGVVISNHQSNFDIIPGAYIIPPKTYTIGKKSILYIPFFGLFYYLTGNILIDRHNKKKAFGTLDAAANAILKEDKSIWIMPEGTRSKGRGLLPFKKGPFVTAIKTQRPVTIIAWSNYVGKLDLNKPRAGVILTEVLPPIETTGLTLDDVNILKEKCYNQLKMTIQRLDLEVEAIEKKV